ncbi:hypothetical protein SmJEL517_g01750 [Synchytrium microbalum]|uniref:GST C-terminal domain-containing protein n=1 Tax=Synchytrium microbalum TaxID=1806994 RepID=A0A507CEK8_9FUNG|nr:uncharacterized protein SmJEL517_g01750 [Synchytrium microbalum]TPX36015.1 hypothetical protein SmJEL517_g01750 [Synchytrium microbalum]
MASIGKIYTSENSFVTAKLLIIAKYSGVSVQIETVTSLDKLKTKLPLTKLPAFEAPDGFVLYESNAIAYFIAASSKSNMLGASIPDAARIQQYVYLAMNEIAPAQSAWVYALLGWAGSQASIKQGQDSARKVMNALNIHLKQNTFLVSNSVTIADIFVVVGLLPLYRVAFDTTFISEFKNVNRWFSTCINQPHFVSILGKVEIPCLGGDPAKYKAPARISGAAAPPKIPTGKYLVKTDAPKRTVALSSEERAVFDTHTKKYPYLNDLESKTTVEIQMSNLDSSSIASLSALLALPLMVQDLNLSCKLTESNALGENGAAALAQGLALNKSLKRLYLSNCSLGDTGVKSMAEALSKNTCVDEIYLSQNGITDGGAKLLASALSKNARLQLLSLTENNIADDGASKLADVAKNSSSGLVILYLIKNKIKDAGAKYVAGVWNSINPSKSALAKVFLYGNDVSDDAKDALKGPAVTL